MYSIPFQMAGMPKVHEHAMNQLSRNLNISMELVASNSFQNPEKIPPEPTSLHVSINLKEFIPVFS